MMNNFHKKQAVNAADTLRNYASSNLSTAASHGICSTEENLEENTEETAGKMLIKLVPKYYTRYSKCEARRLIIDNAVCVFKLHFFSICV